MLDQFPEAVAAATVTGGVIVVVAEEGDDGLGALVAGGADGVPRRPVDGGHGAADAAVHASSSAPFSLPIGNVNGGEGSSSKVAIAVRCVRI